MQLEMPTCPSRKFARFWSPLLTRRGARASPLWIEQHKPLTATRSTSRGTAGSEMSQTDTQGFRPHILWR
jgi:hypothetical protein